MSATCLLLSSFGYAQDHPHVDSVGVSYENGKLNLPKAPDNKSFQNEARQKLPGTNERNIKEKSQEQVKGKLTQQTSLLKDNESEVVGKKETYVGEAQRMADSVRQVVGEAQALASEVRGGGVEQRVYSNRALKRLYDSLGVSRIDSIRATMPIKKEISKEDLLSALNAPMPVAPVSGPVEKPGDLKGLMPKDEKLPDVPEIPKVPDLGSVKLPDSTLRDLLPARGFRFPADSMGIIDSIRKVNLSRENLMLKEDKVDDQLKSVMVKNKPRFWDKAYFEGVVSFIQNKDGNSVQLSPAMGYRVTEDLSFGLGPNVLLHKEEKKWNFDVGYRAFAKYEIFSQMAYLQVEDMVDPVRVNTEYARNTPHSILAGAGYLQPIFGSVALNLCVLYRVNNGAYSDGQMSPWVVRLGLSTRKRTDKSGK